jgi:hypothetical protein
MIYVGLWKLIKYYIKDQFPNQVALYNSIGFSLSLSLKKKEKRKERFSFI